MKFLRYLFFIPICILVISLIYWLFGLLLTWFIGLSTFWLIIILIFFGGMIWGVFRTLSAMIMGFTSKISPSFELSFWTITTLSVINGIWNIYKSWTLDIHYSGKIIFGTIIITILVIELTVALILGTLLAKKES